MSEHLRRKSIELKRPEPGTIEVGELARIKDDDVKGNPMYRVLAFMPQIGDPSKFLAWLGPIDLSPQDIQEFQQYLMSPHRMPEKFKTCRPAAAELLIKVLDS